MTTEQKAGEKELNLICTDSQQFPICPWCGYEHRDNYCDFGEGENECEDCGKPFIVTHVTVYTTEKKGD